jgi:hypothetical protein
MVESPSSDVPRTCAGGQESRRRRQARIVVTVPVLVAGIPGW